MTPDEPKYRVYVFTCRDVGKYMKTYGRNQDALYSIKLARHTARGLGHAKVEGSNGFFEEYENGELIKKSLPTTHENHLHDRRDTPPGPSQEPPRGAL